MRKIINRHSVVKMTTLVCFINGLVGCTVFSQYSSKEYNDPSVESQSGDAKNPIVEANTKPVSSSQIVDRLLQDAQRALTRDQLMTPPHNNAFDKYKAVLLFDKNNTEALLGIGKVVERYCELAQSSAAKGNFKQAKIFLSRAESIEPNLSQVLKTREFIARAQKNFTQLITLENPTERQSDHEIALSRQDLQKRSKELASELKTIAQQVRQTDQYLLIVTPTDADGRWVYQEMKKAVPGYRLRGDIRRGKIPKIVLQAPLP